MRSRISRKITVMGESGVGKSSIIKRFVLDHFSQNQESTVGAAFFVKSVNIDGEEIKLEIWDTAGEERYHCLMPIYYRGAGIILLVCDLTDFKSYEKAKMWLTEIKKNYMSLGPENYPIIYLVGNKLDLIVDYSYSRKVSYDILHEYASENQLFLFEVSAQSGHNIIELFHHIGHEIKKNEIPGTYKGNGVNLFFDKIKDENKCC